MFRIRFLIAVALLAVVGCGPQATAPAASQSAPAVITRPTAMVMPAPTPELTHEEDLSGKAFILRDLNPEFKESFNSDYPAVITRLRDEDLQGFRCTRTYVNTSQSGELTPLYYFDDAVDARHPLTDATLAGLAASINGDLKNTQEQLVQISACETETGQRIVLYELGRDYWDSSPYIGVIDADKVVQIDAPDVDIIYSSCQHVLAVDRSGNLYYECGGSDGAGYALNVYSVNLVSYEETLLADCVHSPDGSYCE